MAVQALQAADQARSLAKSQSVDSKVLAGVPDMQAAMAALAEAQSTASALTYTNPGVLAQSHPLAMLLANSSWLTHIPNIQQLLTQLPAPHMASPSHQQPLWSLGPSAAAPAGSQMQAPMYSSQPTGSGPSDFGASANHSLPVRHLSAALRGHMLTAMPVPLALSICSCPNQR